MYSVHWRKPSTNAFHAFHLCTMQHQTCEQEHTADPHVLFQHLGVDFYRRTSDKACTLGQFCWPVVQWSCQANGLLQNLPRRLSGVHQRVRLRWEDWEKNCRILDLKHSSLEQWWFSVGANFFFCTGHTRWTVLLKAFLALFVWRLFWITQWDLALLIFGAHPSTAKATVQMSSAEEADFPHNLSCWPGAVHVGSSLRVSFDVLVTFSYCNGSGKLKEWCANRVYIYIRGGISDIAVLVRLTSLLCDSSESFWLHSNNMLNWRCWGIGALSISSHLIWPLAEFPFGEILSPHRISVYILCISWSPSICQAFIPQVIGDIIYLQQSLCAPCDLRVLTAAEAQWWLLLQSSISAEYLVANSVLLVMNSWFISGDDGRCFFWQHCPMRSMSLRQSPAVARFFLTKTNYRISVRSRSHMHQNLGDSEILRVQHVRCGIAQHNLLPLFFSRTKWQPEGIQN